MSDYSSGDISQLSGVGGSIVVTGGIKGRISGAVA